MVVEACLQTVSSAVAAERAGAGRIELCAALSDGGVTPSAGLLRSVREGVAIPLHVLIRPRPGDFVYGEAEIRAMILDIREVRRSGGDGVVIGALTAAGEVAREVTARLLDAARPLSVTFHRAVDQTPDLEAAVATLADLGIDRVLTSGGAATADQGIPALARLVRSLGSTITVQAGGRVRAGNAGRIARETGIRELHLGPVRGPRGELDLDQLALVLAELRP